MFVFLLWIFVDEHFKGLCWFYSAARCLNEILCLIGGCLIVFFFFFLLLFFLEKEETLPGGRALLFSELTRCIILLSTKEIPGSCVFLLPRYMCNIVQKWSDARSLPVGRRKLAGEETLNYVTFRSECHRKTKKKVRWIFFNAPPTHPQKSPIFYVSQKEQKHKFNLIN